MKVFIFSILLAVTSIASANVGAEVPLVCNVNKSESFLVYTKAQKVAFSVFMQSEVQLTMTSFTTYKCPGCYDFQGSANGEIISAKLRGQFRQQGLEQTMSYTVNGVQQPEISCFNPKK